MCHFHTWFYDAEKGYVVECQQCKKIQVCIGNVAATFQYEEFEGFRQYVSHVRNYHQPFQDHDAKSVVLKTPCEGLHILLTERELDSLYSMLEYADNERKVKQLMDLFE